MTAILLDEDRDGPATGAAAAVVFGHYRLGARLGEGGYGEVYAAWDAKLRREVAIKCVKHAGAASSAGLMREARLAASLRHAAFVKVFAIESDGTSHFIVMEKVDGGTLKEVIGRGPVALPDALDWIAQIARAMRDAHEAGMAHGDLKPSNFMLEPGGNMRILDFGLAVRDDLLATSSLPQAELQGTIAYMAPERLHGAAVDLRGDVYALGVVLYELACGVRPFPGLAGLALAAAQVQSSSDGWNYPPALGAPLIGLIRAMTARKPEQRLASMDDVLRHLGALAAHGDGGQGGIGVLARAGAGAGVAHARPGWAWGGALLVLLALAGAAAWAWKSGPAPALATLQQAMAYLPTSAARQFDQGLAGLTLFDRPGSLDGAAAHFQRILARNPDSAAAVAGMSLVFSLRYVGDQQDKILLQKADAGAQQALQLNDQLALAHAARGWVLDLQGQRDAALREHERALQLDPGNFFAWYGKVRALRHARRYALALDSLAQAGQRFPRERVFTDELGSVYYEQGDNTRAAAAFRRSIALQPDAVIAYANLSATLLRQNRGDEALRVLQQGLQVRPSAKLYGNLGNALFLRGDYVGAAQAFEDAVSPVRGAPGEYLNWANLADTLLWIPGREQQARQAYGRARDLLEPRLARAPNDVQLVSHMGLYSARAGARAQALALLARAVALAPDAADVWFRAGLADELLGERVQALAAIARARRLGYPLKFIEAEPDLVALRRDPAYHPD